MLSCPQCGTAHRPGQKFCDECGHALAGTADSPAPKVAPGPAIVSTELRFVSVLFVDLVGFTSLSEGREAEDVRELLGRYFTAARTVVERYGGVIEKFIGDAVMAVWGAPVAREDDAERAVRAALEIVDAVQAFGTEVGAPDLRARAGVVTGQVAAMESHEEGIVVGDRVNTASRVQSVAAPGTVLVDDVTRQVTASAIAFEDAGRHTVKGKVEPLQLWRAVRVVSGVGGRDREQLVEAPFMGRDTELRLVKDLFHATIERGSARLVAISGDAGVGKTRLRREFVNYLDGLADTFLLHLGRCLSHGDGVAYWALAEMVRQRLGIPEEARSEEVSRKLEAGLAEWVPDPAERAFIAPRLGALLGVAEPGLDRAELFAGWRLFFERLAANEPVLLILEDMQWADSGLIEFVEQLLDWSSDVPIFILSLARPELAARREGWPAGRRGATTVTLEPLDDASIRALLLGAVDDLPRAAVSRIAERAQGVPLYAIEMVRSLVDRGALESRDGRLVAVGELGELDVPASLNALLAARLDALTAQERSLVKAMSVFGGSFPRDAAVALTDMPDDELDAALAGLTRKQVLIIRADPLSPDRGQYAFAQGLLRTVAYETLARHERKLRHLAAADHLARAFPDEGEEVAEVIANHLLDALGAARDDPDADPLRARTVTALRRAARRAATIGAPEAAERAYRTAGELADAAERGALLQAAGEMAIRAGAYEDALRLLDDAGKAYLAEARLRERALLAHPIGVSLIRVGRVQEAAERIGEAIEALTPGSTLDPDVARLNAILGRALVFAGDHAAAAGPLETALVISQALELPDVLGEALVNKAIVCEVTGRIREAEYLYAAAEDVAERDGLAAVRDRSLTNLANFQMLWDRPEAYRHIEAALSLTRRRGDRYGEGLVSGMLVQIHLWTGRWEELEELAAELAAQDDDRPSTPFGHTGLLLLCVHRGAGAQAAVHLDHISSWREREDADLRSVYEACQVLLSRVDGRPEEALEFGLRTLEPAIAAVGLADGFRHAWPAVLGAAIDLGRLDDARQVLGVLADRPRGHVPPFLRAQLARGQALLAAAEGRHETVEAGLNAAIDGFAGLGYPHWLAITQTDLAAWLIDQDRRGEAEPLLEDAIAALTPLRAAPALDRAIALTGAPTGELAR